MTVIWSDDFYTDFKKEFLREVLSIELRKDRNIPITRYGPTIDAVFTRYIENKFELFTIFSYHKILVTLINCEIQRKDEVSNIIEV